MTPFGEIGPDREFIRISRRSLCDECADRATCISLESRKLECARFRPAQYIFNECRVCGRSYEVHTAWRNDFLDECPECNEGRRKERMMR